MAMSCDDELNWRNYLSPDHYNVPLHALRYSACMRLSYYLDDPNPVIHNMMVPNFGGLAELVGFDSMEIANMERAKSPTRQLLDDWKNRVDLDPTVGRLIEFLAKLGREDVLTDCCELIQKEIKEFLEKKKQFEDMKSIPVQDQTVSQGPGYEEIPIHITMEDVMYRQETYYDAFVCYNASPEDLLFVKELIRKFEGEPYNFRLFVPHRNELAGLNAHTITAKIISERCRHMIVVLSPSFLESPACEFQSTFAHALSPGARNKRIVPIKIQDCPTPNILRIMACCDFTKKDLWDWSWERLAKSIMVPLSAEDYQVSVSQSMEGLIRPSNIDLNLDSGVSQMSYSPSSSRSSSPAPAYLSRTQPVVCRTPRTHEKNVCSSSTVPIMPKKGPLKTSTETFRNIFRGKKPSSSSSS